jgi:DNA-binding response OmpR family regulator
LPSVLAIVHGLSASMEGRSLIDDRLTIELCSDAQSPIDRAASQVYDLLVLAEMTVDEQQQIAASFQQHRRWRLAPILYVQSERTPGISIPAGYRPEIDSITRGNLDAPAVQRRIRAMAREGVGEAEMVVAGGFELDPLRCLLRLSGFEVTLTEREAEILAMLLARPNRTVSASEIIERGWGMDADDRYLQILRRHVSNIRRKLEQTPAARSVRTVRGSGYRFDVRLAG